MTFFRGDTDAGTGSGIALADVPGYTAAAAGNVRALRSLGQGAGDALDKTTADGIYGPLTQLQALQQQVNAIPTGGGSGVAARVADDRNVVEGAYTTAAGALSDGVVTGGNYISRFVPQADVGVVDLHYANWGKQSGANTITVTATVQRPDGKRVIVRFGPGGDTKGIIPAGGTARGRVPLHVKKGSVCFVRTFVEARDAAGNLIAGGKWPRYRQPPYWISGNNGERTSESNGESDLTQTGAPTGTTGLMYFPAKITAVTPIPANTVSVCIDGDSISVGSGDRPDQGLFVYALNDAYAYMQLGIIGEGGSYFIDFSNESAARRWVLSAGATHVWCEYGVNDLASTGSNRSAASVKSQMLTLWTERAAGGAKVRQTTITPHASSTDGWATLTNQTPDANNAAFQDVNAWLRDGAPVTVSGSVAATGSHAAGTVRGGDAGHPLYADPTTVGDRGIDDVAAVLEDGGATAPSGKWALAYPPSDAFHPTQAGHLAAAAVLNKKWLGQ